MELRNRLQQEFSCSLPTTVVFKYPTVELLADYLLAEFCQPAVGGNPPGKNAADRSGMVGKAGQGAENIADQDLTALSEDEAESLLLAKLAELNF
jgi:hypothetical protein